MPIKADTFALCESHINLMRAFAVVSQARNRYTIAAGIAFAFRKDGKGGYVAEGHIHGSADSLREILSWKMEEMARIRNVEFGEIKFEAEELEIPMDHYGCCISALVFTEYR